jgi:hypothetical protein
MFRFLFSILATVSVVRWSYHEAKMMFPESAPLIEAAAEYVQIPTHDKWGNYALGRAMLGFLESNGVALNEGARPIANTSNSATLSPKIPVVNCGTEGQSGEIQRIAAQFLNTAGHLDKF